MLNAKLRSTYKYQRNRIFLCVLNCHIISRARIFKHAPAGKNFVFPIFHEAKVSLKSRFRYSKRLPHTHTHTQRTSRNITNFSPHTTSRCILCVYLHHLGKAHSRMIRAAAAKRRAPMLYLRQLPSYRLSMSRSAASARRVQGKKRERQKRDEKITVAPRGDSAAAPCPRFPHPPIAFIRPAAN